MKRGTVGLAPLLVRSRTLRPRRDGPPDASPSHVFFGHLASLENQLAALTTQFGTLSPQVGALCTQLSVVTDQTDLLGGVLVAVNGLLDPLTGGTLPVVPAVLGGFSCP